MTRPTDLDAAYRVAALLASALARVGAYPVGRPRTAEAILEWAREHVANGTDVLVDDPPADRRMVRVAELRGMGWSWVAIGLAVGVDPQEARDLHAAAVRAWR